MMPALAHLAEALAFYEALRIDVLLDPLDGLWRLTVRGEAVSVVELIERAGVLGMGGLVVR